MNSSASRLVPEQGLDFYLREIRKFPLLSAEEEVSLFRRWRDRQDIEAAHKVVSAHLRLVVRVAKRYRGYGLPVTELISEGSVGMMRAVRRFDPERGFRFATYAMWWIRAAIQEYILHSWSMVKMGTTAAQKKLFFNLSRLKGKMQALEEGDLKPEQSARIAHILAVPERDVLNMNRRLAVPDHSLNVSIGEDRGNELQDSLVDCSESQEAMLANHEEISARRAMLPAALETLNARERHILIERWMKDEPTTLDDLSKHYKVSRERVRQIEVRAIEKLRDRMKLRPTEMVVKAAEAGSRRPLSIAQSQ